MTPPIRNARASARMLKDSTQIRGIIQAMYAWPQRGSDRFPLPSLLDRDDATIAGSAESKDTTANILSILVQEAFVVPEMLVSPAEANPKIRVFRGYQFKNPTAAASPAKALWDPALSADFTSEQGGNISYAHMLPHGERLKEWACNFNQGCAMLGNRGPEIASVTKTSDGAVNTAFASPKSRTFLIHGSKTKWEGLVGFNDNHVDYVLGPVADPNPNSGSFGGRYMSTDGATWPDCLFYDEPDDANGIHAFLGIFIKAGKERKDFVGIWD